MNSTSDAQSGSGSVRRVLMIAFHFPPMAGSSGIQRTLRFVQHLPAQGWQPLVLSAHPRAYEAISSDLMSQIPAGTIVRRPFALDAARHLAIAGRYPGFMAQPDRYRSWEWGAIPTALSMIRKYRPDVIWSTYPIATAHLIAHRLHRISGIPWVADFRDPMAQEGYPADPRTWRWFKRLEECAARDAASLVFVTEGAKNVYRERYPDAPASKFVVIENGYDEESFASVGRQDSSALNPGSFTLLHSGIVYPSERDPRALFEALGRLRSSGDASVADLRIRFRAPVHVDLLQQLAAQTNTGDLIEILPSIPYRDALQEMLRSDGLLVMQGANCNEQIPAKLYEYLRARRPILGLADPNGDTGKAMLQAGVDHVDTLEDTHKVESVLRRFRSDVQMDAPSLPMSESIVAMSRKARSMALAHLMGAISAQSNTVD